MHQAVYVGASVDGMGQFDFYLLPLTNRVISKVVAKLTM